MKNKRLWKQKNKNQISRIACWNINIRNKKDQEIITEIQRRKIVSVISRKKKKRQGTIECSNYILFTAANPNSKELLPKHVYYYMKNTCLTLKMPITSMI